jgi:hypothetical protein
MAKYRKKPVVVEAVQWFQHGDHAQVQMYRDGGLGDKCQHCGASSKAHGWLITLEGGFAVCPGDFIITGIKGEFYPCKPDIFEATYEPVPETPE